ncbi:MAG: protein-L-isoaspartate O-methyltransferase [Bauldia sp.]|uniref:protein-L-isoaspartate O-methyltransferase family protein n=1 Tax=Bauldia sp. TaxID=2575872 RepID=UPI001D44EC74|nr:protein-L-isoaspartate O-methyltransferase [Bauldia sp.]MCB1495008.1 protein-L-isoaspartate O-methyltransferase [Bauldia sp.]
MTDFASARATMVDTQIRTEGVTDHDVLRAMAEIPRERFLPAASRQFAYIDDDILVAEPAAGRPARYLMRPTPLARLMQEAEIGQSDFVLVVGCPTGYSAAILARLAGSVVALESDEELAAKASENLLDQGIDNVAVVTGPLEAGYPSEGPYDVILLGGAVETVPQNLFDQLKEGGRLVAVVGYGRAAPAMVYTHTDDDFGGRAVFDVHLPPLPGFQAPKSFVF